MTMKHTPARTSARASTPMPARAEPTPAGRTRVTAARLAPALVALALTAPMTLACSKGNDTTLPGTVPVTAPPATAAPTSAGTAPVSATTAAGATTTSAPKAATTTAPTAGGAVTPTTASTKCLTANLSASVEDAGSSAGHRHMFVVFTNTGSATCTLQGYPGLSFLDGTGAQAGKPARRGEAPGPLVTLPAGGKAHANVNQVTATFDGCGASVPVTSLRIIPPDMTDDHTIPDAGQTCQDETDLTVFPMNPGATMGTGELSGP